MRVTRSSGRPHSAGGAASTARTARSPLQLQLQPRTPFRVPAQAPQSSRRHQQATSSSSSSSSTSTSISWAAAAAQQLAVLAAAASLIVAAPAHPAAAEGELSIAFPASGDPEIQRAQKTLVESWAYVDSLFLEQPGGSHELWAKALQDALAASFKAKAPSEVTQLTRGLLASLGDPYTRLLAGDEDAALAAEQEGKIVATGLGLAAVQPDGEQQQQQQLAVAFVIPGSPAAAAGVQEGDLLLAVAGQPVAGSELRAVYKQLATETDVTLSRQPPGSQRYTVRLKPAPLEFLPVQWGVVQVPPPAPAQAGSDNSSSPTSSTPPGATTSSSPAAAAASVGYLKLITFSATAPQEVAQALQEMQQQQQQSGGGARLAGIVVDLRDNPGGIVEAGVDIAQDFLSAGQTLCLASDKSGVEEQVVLSEAHTLTQLPLVVLVNHGTASTSELLAGALHDELHAPLVGTQTYGKGRSQRVLGPLSDGSTLLVSTLQYRTPSNTVIDGVGLAPDVACDPQAVLGQRWAGGRVDGDSALGSLLDDPCVKLAAERLVAGGSSTP